MSSISMPVVAEQRCHPRIGSQRRATECFCNIFEYYDKHSDKAAHTSVFRLSRLASLLRLVLRNPGGELRNAASHEGIQEQYHCASSLEWI
jgi:hypothetical protein